MSNQIRTPGIVYACNCLNIKIHLHNKYPVDQHESELGRLSIADEHDTFTGRKFDLGIGGVVMVRSFFFSKTSFLVLCLANLNKIFLLSRNNHC